MKEAIAIFAYKRVDLLNNLLCSLIKCNSVMDYDIVIFSDGSKSIEDKSKVDDVRRFIKKIQEKFFLKRIKYVFREKNLGLSQSIILGIDEMFDEYDAVICLEDDLIVSEDFLNFMSKKLKKYADDLRIWSISGYAPYLSSLGNIDCDTFLAYRACSWGWGTWKNRWKMVDWEVSDYDSFSKSCCLRKMFNRGGKDMSLLLDFQMNGLIDSWAIRWCYAQWEQGMFTVFPKYSRVQNNGFGCDATHTKKSGEKQQVCITSHPLREDDAIINIALLEEMYQINKCNRLKMIIKLFLSKYTKLLWRMIK